MDATWYPVIKSLHLIFMVTFFAGTFYIVRLFIYHREALSTWEPDRTILCRQLMLMERKLWYIITWPSLVLMFAFGLWMFVLNPALIKQPWMHAKLGFIALLFAYHFKNHALFLRARRNEVPWSSFALRLWNEGATVVLFAVVFLAVIKRLDWQYGALGLVVLLLVLLLAVNAYRKQRMRDAEARGPGTGTDAR
ncbi:MAG: CopD family protein [Flavobacteriales bacterium]